MARAAQRAGYVAVRSRAHSDEVTRTSRAEPSIVATDRKPLARRRGARQQVKAKKERAKEEVKEYPLAKEDWSSCDESEEDESGWDEVAATMGFRE